MTVILDGNVVLTFVVLFVGDSLAVLHESAIGSKFVEYVIHVVCPVIAVLYNNTVSYDLFFHFLFIPETVDKL